MEFTGINNMEQKFELFPNIRIESSRSDIDIFSLHN